MRDSSGRMIAGAAVYLQAEDGAAPLTAHTDEKGSFQFPALHGGWYVLRTQARDYNDATFGPYALGLNESKTVDLTLESPQQPQAQVTSSPKAPAADGPPEFFDEPQFTVAGVTDGNNQGGHGSNVIARTTDSMAKDIVSFNTSGGRGAGRSAQPGGSDDDPAEKTLRAAAEREPGSFEANHRLGKLLAEKGKAPQALPYLERASPLKPGDYQNAYWLALAYAEAGRYQRARTHARALLTLPENSQNDLADVHHLLGDVEEKLGNPLEAVREYERAAGLNPSESNFYDWGADLLLHRAIEPAVQVFSKGHRLFPQSARMLVGLGVAWYSDGSYEQASQRLCEASDLDPSDPKPYLFLGKIQEVESKQSECSIERLERFVKLHPENALARYYYGVNLWKRGRGAEDVQTLAQAKSELRRAVQLDPTLGVAYLQLGVLYAERKDLPAAISCYEDAVKASPQLEEAHYRMAQAYKRTGEASKAERELQLYREISKRKNEEAEREQRESRQLVYTLRGSTPASPPR